MLPFNSLDKGHSFCKAFCGFLCNFLNGPQNLYSKVYFALKNLIPGSNVNFL